MAAENPDTIEFELVADVYKLSRGADGKVALTQDGQTLLKELGSAKISEEGQVTLQGRDVGKVNVEATGSLESLREKLGEWFPPGLVHHAHSLEKFEEHNKGLVVGKFSAKWCGPCKAVAPKIDKMSLEYPDVTFIHVDEDEVKDLFNREGIRAYPTFKFYMDGKAVGEPIQGADVAGIEKRLVALGANKVAVQRNTTEIIPEDVTITCQRDHFRIEKTEAGKSLTINGDMVAAAGKCPQIEINREKKTVSFGRGGGEIYLGGGADINAIADVIEVWFPSYVTHVNKTTEFDELVQTGITCAKFSAEWCGPCKRIAPIINQLAGELQGKVKFLHIDVDQLSELSGREGVRAMPTFQFWMDGVKKPDMTVQGGDLQKVLMNLGGMGVDVMPVMMKLFQ